MINMIKHNKLLTNMFVYFMLFTFMAFSVNATQTVVDLGTAEEFAILAKSGISTTGTTSILGDIGVSPIDSTAITGFGLIMDSSNEFATSSIVTGKAYAADYTPPTPTKMTTAISDMRTAYTDAAGRSNPTATELGAGNIDGMTLTSGLYKWGTGVEIPNSVTLSGGANDVWIFQVAQDLTVGNGAIITLSGGAQAKNIFWQVAGQTTLGTTSDFKGIILSQTGIAMNTGAKLNGRALAQTAVTLDASTVTAPTVSTTTTPTSKPASDTDSGTSSGSGSSLSEWECEEWSECSPQGISTKTCKQINGDATTRQEQPCTPIKTNTATATQTNTDSSVKTNQEITQELTQELSEQIKEGKEEIKTGEYTSSIGQILRVRELAHNVKQLRANGVTAQTDLNITAETDSRGETRFTAKLRNGQKREIKIMPDTASKKALEMLRVKVCSPNNNCTIELKDVGTGTAEKIQYEMQLERHSKILGIFQKKMHVSAYVDAQTGETKVHKPWWAFLAVEY